MGSQQDYSALLENLAEVWREVAANAFSPAEVDPPELAWQIAAAAGTLLRFGEDPVKKLPLLRSEAFLGALVGRVADDDLEQDWVEMQEAYWAIDQEASTGVDHAFDDAEARRRAESWVLHRDELASVLETLRALSGDSKIARRAALQALIAVGELDAVVQQDLDLLFHAVPMCRGVVRASHELGLQLVEREDWWWFRPVQSYEATEKATFDELLGLAPPAGERTEKPSGATIVTIPVRRPVRPAAAAAFRGDVGALYDELMAEGCEVTRHPVSCSSYPGSLQLLCAYDGVTLLCRPAEGSDRPPEVTAEAPAPLRLGWTRAVGEEDYDLRTDRPAPWGDKETRLRLRFGEKVWDLVLPGEDAAVEATPGSARDAAPARDVVFAGYAAPPIKAAPEEAWLAEPEIAAERVLTIAWKGGTRRLPLPGDAILQQAPDPKLARWLAQLALDLRGFPRAPKQGYGAAMRAIGASNVMAVFGPLGNVQRFCARRGLWDLSALIVNAKMAVPGSGHYGDECVDVEKWRDYMQLALDALRRYRGRT